VDIASPVRLGRVHVGQVGQTVMSHLRGPGIANANALSPKRMDPTGRAGMG